MAMRLPESQMIKEILLVRSLKLQVSFAKEPYERDHILQKRPKISGRHLYSDACIFFPPFSFPSQENTDRVCFIDYEAHDCVKIDLDFDFFLSK